ncbi:Murein DD-endopeptidase MepM and murein hydrolase activator NlpD, contain LysM domain [Thermosyntropha lipolytica DSM 11003]|uniref:Murein DD-endopeptidase MepM and murein hydrolase activator NlpD, contain LysM domain n=1 Tax=Thermosyntropha lipolytica DSM 11003 TaxID=1123382 RepID=A0A1M5R617_9FIRM|nr:M23 family metallopeptidase [Thermosyntropha lipolytica]SHH21419.1 Murein DD-endopeptidase MepM and murein hydrolase activator NlpD, contain LysM domain [Thermosyntropha lipolytica DSM 11003]
MQEYIGKKWEEIYHDKRLFILSLAIIVLALSFLIWGLVIRTPAYTVYADGKEILRVKHIRDVKDVLALLEKEKESEYKKDIVLATDFRFKRSFVPRNELTGEEEIKEKLQKVAVYSIEGASVVVNGKEQVFLADKQSAQKLLARLKKEGENLDEGEKLLAVAFEEKVEVKEKLVPVDKVLSPEEAYILIKTGTNRPEKYIVKEGDSLWLIARRHDMYVDDIVQANNLKSDKLMPGDELILVRSKPLINVMARVEGQKVEEIPYETKVIVDKNAPWGVRVKQEGKNGKKKVVYIAVKKNGTIQNREIKEETIIENAVDKIVVKGSKVTLASRGGGESIAGSGRLAWPVYGTITSPFGARGGRHTGVDIAARTGTPIRAADSGTVIFAGWQGGYGKLVIIDHGNGLVTRYAHCNSIYVSTGQRVSKGEVIASVGSTGNSTGSHLHFETLSYGSFRNPLNFLR